MEYTYASGPPDKVQGQVNPPPYQEPPPAGFGPGHQQYGVGGYPQQLDTRQPYPQQTVVAVQQNAPLSPPENDYLGYSIFTLLCCCMPLGIAALVHSITTREANINGDRLGAERSSRYARILNHIALGLGLMFLVLVIIYVIVAFVVVQAHN